ncbi:MAG: ribosome biogenesis GTPase Der [Acidobacteria bacterium]|nr:ribosome biogenesis GTPase Der [Acidobacteriota bacterium]
MARIPIVVIVGRPNVGKSTLFNRLTASRKALVHDLPGVTRDRIVGEARVPGGRRVMVVDTGGLLMEDEDHFIPLIREQAEAAMSGADAVIFLLDGASGPLPEDHDLAGMLRLRGVPVVPVVNKADRLGVDLGAGEFFSLGLGEPISISAEHGTGLSELWEALEPWIEVSEDEAAEAEVEGEEERELRIAIIGRPNVGKSSILNRLLGSERVLVSEVPGTTRDAIDEVVEWEGRRFRFVDTAGIRRKGKTDRGPEVLSVVMARRAIERAHLCLVVVDAERGITRRDAHVAGYAWEAHRGVALVVNKWDLAQDRARWRERLEDEAARHLKFMRHAPVLYLSAETGQGVSKILPTLVAMGEAFDLDVNTSELNVLLRRAWSESPPSAGGGREAKLYYATQVGRRPPAFALFTNLSGEVHFSYQRHLENVLREYFQLAGVPIKVMIRGRKRRGK